MFEWLNVSSVAPFNKGCSGTVLKSRLLLNNGDISNRGFHEYSIGAVHNYSHEVGWYTPRTATSGDTVDITIEYIGKRAEWLLLYIYLAA